MLAKEVLKFWQESGILDDIEEDKKIYVADLYNSTAKYILEYKMDEGNTSIKIFDLLKILVIDLNTNQINNFNFIKLIDEVNKDYPVVVERCQDLHSFGRGYLHDFIYVDEFLAKYKKDDYQK